MNHEKIVSIEKLAKTWFEPTDLTLFTNGCFDLFHAGHAKALSDIKKDAGKDSVLVVGINSDKSVKNLKGESRPIIPEEQRAYIVACHEAVDMVFIFDEEDVSPYIKIIRPDFWYKSSDYTFDSLNEKEKLNLLAVDGTVKLINLVEDISTTKIVKKIGRNLIEKIYN
jgi:rfaE bifunctional protein nucleotidyltransferase chain/domain